MQLNHIEVAEMIRARQEELLRDRQHQPSDRGLWSPRSDRPGRVRRAIGRRMVAIGTALVG